jgi:hypothetical protein
MPRLRTSGWARHSCRDLDLWQGFEKWRSDCRKTHSGILRHHRGVDVRPITVLCLPLLVACADGEELGALGLGNHAAGASMTRPSSPVAVSGVGAGGSTSSGEIAPASDAASVGGGGAGGARTITLMTDGSDGSSQVDAGSNETPRDAAPRAEAGLAPTGISLLYKCTDSNPNDSQIAPSYKIVNVGGPTENLSDFKIRYFLSDEGKAKLLSDFMYAEVNGGAGYRDIRNEAQVRIMPAAVVAAGADTVVEVGFTAAAGTLTDGQTSTINFVVHTEGYALNLSESDDYSHDLARTDFGTNAKVTLYFKEQLIAGAEP